jgi:hypothetical protein
MDPNLIKIIGVAVAALTAGAFLTFKLTQNRNTQNSGRITQVKQKGIQAGGDVAGGDIHKNTTK